MQKTTTIITTFEELEEMSCDRCGAVDTVYGFNDSYVIPFKHEFGYGSPNDGDTILFDICQECLESMLKISDVKYRVKSPYPPYPELEEDADE